ncbi:ArsS family sensor histidine kinase [Campylobacter gastrosuis]|uniref:histidine kinase n=1 Tax=Campylobacter gastrosuis TaxID=2974576 RepID=A0ABT7HM71_9BACT|nr:ArsS family sensor histidine kinase [Campylobacter gastrosuis]MDL0087770.1 ArsS family sensor histidine kinase [Campylobacter gastrosuis]MDL0087981.1 ArsS family sensor histidine kinase [Campylobacter gastrosuis]
MKSSITTKITIIFAIAFTLVCVLFLTLARIERDHAIEKVRDRQISATNYLLSLYEKSKLPQDFNHYFRNFGFESVSSNMLAAAVLSKGEVQFQRHTPVGTVRSIFYDGRLYLQIQNVSFSLLLESNDTKSIYDPLLVGFLISSLFLITFYVSVIRSLSPLKKLNSDIRKFASGNMEVEICLPNAKNKDEIGQVAYEFNNAVGKIKELIHSRQLFLRAIMHELKTPIGKGRIVSEMIANETQKSRLISVFERLDMLINEFGKVEQLLSKSYSLEYQECHFSLILEQTIDLLMLENFDERVKCDIKDDVLLYVDFQLFSLMLKNLIDNALKYADDKKAIVECQSDKIIVKNHGKALEYDIEHYKQAFVRGATSSKTTSGMGLGLYIIEQICDMHKFSLCYEYKDGFHCFIVKTQKI